MSVHDHSDIRAGSCGPAPKSDGDPLASASVGGCEEEDEDLSARFEQWAFRGGNLLLRSLGGRLLVP